MLSLQENKSKVNLNNSIMILGVTRQFLYTWV